MQMEVICTTRRDAIRWVEYSFVKTRFGEMLMAWCQLPTVKEKDSECHTALCFATFTTYLGRERAYSELQRLLPSATLKKSASHEDITATPPRRILLVGTEFQIEIWRALLEIKSGRTITYSALAALAGHPTAVRAAASSVGRNPISVVVPCHRVLPASGGVGNYHSGAEIKRRLLEWEGALP